MLEKLNENIGFEIEITKGIKPGSGIGSSAASAAGAAVAANKLLNNKFSKIELVEFARNGEFLAAGSRIADNVSACIFGGFTLVRATEPVADVIALDFPKLFATVIHPQIEIKTSEAREVLPKNISLQNSNQTMGKCRRTRRRFSKGDYDLIARSLEDFVAEPFRKKLIPHFDELKNRIIKSGRTRRRNFRFGSERFYAVGKSGNSKKSCGNNARNLFGRRKLILISMCRK